jgi:VWFA-related protein
MRSSRRSVFTLAVLALALGIRAPGPLEFTLRAQAAQDPAPPAAGQPPSGQPPGGEQPPTGQPPAGQEPARAQQPIRTGINFVRVDVIVSDSKGEPVLDLKPEEFTVEEDGKRQTIESFSVVKVPITASPDEPVPSALKTDSDEEREAARPDVRLFVILLDDYHVRRGNSMAVRKPLIEFIQNQLSPLDMVALMYPLTPVDDIRFSRNRDAMVRAIEKFEGRKFDYQPRNDLEQQYAMYPATVVERIRNQITMGALKAAAYRMGALREGRKSIIFVSEGFTATLPAQLADPIASMPGIGNPNARRTGVDIRNERMEFANEADMSVDLREVFDVANRQNTSIYAVDPRGLAVFEYDINEGVGSQVDRQSLGAALDTLRVLANNTDGRAIVNRNDLASGMRQIIRDSSGYYLLGYNSSQAPTDGKFHEIKVKVSRRGVDVRARKGYWAYTAEDAARATAPPKPEPPKAVTAALNAIAEPARGRAARFWVGTQQGEDGRTRVTFAWERIAPAPGDRQDLPQAARVSLTASAPDGRPLFRGQIPDDGAERTPFAAAAAASQGGAPEGGSVSFEAPPGQLQLRYNVESASGEVLDSAVRQLTLPDFTQVQVAFSTPQVHRGRTVRDLTAVKANPDAVPSADHEFSRTERLLVRVQAYAPGGIKPDVSARLLNRAGNRMSDLPVQAAEGRPYELELPLASLPAGDYLIELNAKTPSGTAQEVIAFKVGR